MGVLGLFVFSVMSRLLTRTEFGYYAAIMSIVMIFRSLAEAGIGASIVQRKNTTIEFVNSAYTLSLIVGGVATLFVIALSGLFSEIIADRTIQIPLILMSLTLIPYSLNSVYNSILLKELRFLRIGVFQVIAFFFSNALAIMMAALNCGLMSIVVGNILNIVFQNIIFRYASKIKPRLSITRDDVFAILNFGGWLTISRIVGAVYTQIDKILMARLLSILELGNFYRTRGLIEDIVGRIGGIFDTTLFPILSGIQDNKNAVQRAYKKSIDIGSTFFSLLFLLFFFNAKLIIICFLGEKWLDQVTLFRVLSLSMLFYFITRFADCFIRSLAYVRFGFYVQLLSCCLLVMGILFSVRYGSLGIAISVVAVNLISAIVKAVFICKKIDVTFVSFFISSLRGMFYSMPIVIAGTVYVAFFDNSILNSIVFLVFFCLLTAILFVFFPELIGETYAKQVYPFVKDLVIIKTKGNKKDERGHL